MSGPDEAPRAGRALPARVRRASGEWWHRFGRFRRSLRARVAFGIGLPILLALSLLSVVHYLRERQVLEEQARLTAVQLGQVITGSLRHTMLTNDREMLSTILSDIGAVAAIERVQLLNLAGQVMAASDSARLGQVQHLSDPGCAECHQLVPEARRETILLPDEGDLLRIAVPIDNDPACAACHPAQAVHLGMMVVDMSLRNVRQHAVEDLQIDLAISGAITLLMTASIYLLMHRLVVRRVERFRSPLAAYAAGNFEARLPEARGGDEIDELGQTLNRMAGELERSAREERTRSELRQRAIIEERERIARELHDGLAQVLGYVGTKATAIRLLLKKGQALDAEEQLLKLEDAAHELFVDVREAILGLKMAGRRDGLVEMLATYVADFSRLSSLPVEVAIAPGLEILRLQAETELHLLRIVQEALTNVRKHASASKARVSLQNGSGNLELTISDDGVGFAPEGEGDNDRPHFGLSTMRERAEAVGAEFRMESGPGAGTRIVVRLALEMD